MADAVKRLVQHRLERADLCGVRAIPPLLLARQIANAWRSRRRSDWAALPAVTVLLCAWSFGEALGYWTARPV